MAYLLDHLDGVKQTGHDRWISRCPAHEDRHPSLSIRHTETGQWLIHCFAGCGAADVVTALGLEFRDLYPEQLGHHQIPVTSRIPAGDLLALIGREAMVIGLIAGKFMKSKHLNEAEWKRLAQAVSRIGRARDHVG